MKSETPKLLHSAAGRTLMEWSLAAAAGVGADRTIVVVPPDADALVALIPDGIETAVQHVARGTGDAVLAARDALAGHDGDVLVLNADHPLLDAATLTALLEHHRGERAAGTILSFDRTATIGADFGRVVRDGDGTVLRIVEARDASRDELALTEVNAGYYVFRAEELWPALDAVTSDNDQGELYVTDTIGVLAGTGKRVSAYLHDDAVVAKGINTRVDLAEAEAVLRSRINVGHMLAGVTIVDPASTFIDAGVRVGRDAVILPFTLLRGATEVEEGAQVGPHVVAVDAHIGAGAMVGPFCYLRPGARLERGAKAGTYVELKNSSVGAGAKVPHLSYIGDAEIGAGTNIGAGTITANYDGSTKHRTVIGENVRTGSQNVFVAPVTIGDGAWTAAGSAITDDVPPDALGVARAKQTNIEDYARRRRRPS